MRDTTPLKGLKNLGPTIIQRLNEIGVHNRGDLKRVGAVEGHRLIRQRHPAKTIAVCYYLYSLEGALRGLHWNDLPRKVKEDLLSQVR
jgi:DNA transformation protein